MLGLTLAVVENREGLLTVLAAFLIQLCNGCYHGTFGNLLPYLSSYLRQVTSGLEISSVGNNDFFKSDSELTHGDVAMIFAYGGLSQGFSFLIGKLQEGSKLSFIFIITISKHYLNLKAGWCWCRCWGRGCPWCWAVCCTPSPPSSPTSASSPGG